MASFRIIFYFILPFLVSYQTQAAVELTELKASQRFQKSKKRPWEVIYYHLGQFDRFAEIYDGQHRIGLRYKIKKKLKLSVWVPASQDSFVEENYTEWKAADPFIQIQNKTKYKWNRHKFGFYQKHRLYYPLSDRSQERGLQSRYKGELAWHSFLTHRLSNISYVVPSYFFNESGLYGPDDKANPHWQIELISDLLYEVNPRFFLGYGMGYFGRTHHREIDKVKQQEIINSQILFGFRVLDKSTLTLALIHSYDLENPPGGGYQLFRDKENQIKLESIIYLF